MEPSGRKATSIPLNHGEVSGLLQALSLAPSPLSPFRDMLLDAGKGERRPADAVLTGARREYEERIIRTQLDVLARPDRFLEARLSLYGTLPDAARFHASRAVGEDFTVLRPHPEFDAEILFPFSRAEVLQWAWSQLQFSLGEDPAVPDGLTMDLRQFTALLALLDAWKARQADSLARRQPLPPDRQEIPEGEILRALEAGRGGNDRRFLVTLVDETLRGLARPGNLPSLGLAPADPALPVEGLEPWVREDLLERTPGGFVVGAGLGELASGLFTWISCLSFHDVQVLGGGSGGAQAREDFLMSWCTPRAVWVLAADGLTGAGPDSGALRFALRPMGVRDAVGFLERFLEPADAPGIRADLYAGPAPAAEVPPPSPSAAVFCRKCGRPLRASARFCGGCGSPGGPA